MIAKKSYYMSTLEHKDTILAEVYVDRDLIKVMQAEILDKIEEAAIYQHRETDSHEEIDDTINYIRDLIDSYKNLNETLDDIEAGENISNIPEDEEDESQI